MKNNTAADRLAEKVAAGEIMPGHWLDDDGAILPEYREQAAKFYRREPRDEASLLRFAEARK